ncbi:class A beta-lactamase-related serine hydrolase [Sphingomonas sp. BN140010]|uniref:beta-lactamase n=1 Tax=Sphingomonas arvum TaxID=2992113 RepID=A0ABT3JFB7_9SPHN|nr:serine hydrolase [Sphingomonas sp. BN140010]MCW3797765.1 class A beta-lactamase-related serine hydrolase [Sphingomonas sp. BN140010]
MTSLGLRIAALGLALAPASCSAGAQPTPNALVATAPAALSARIAALGASFAGRVGIAVESVDQGWRAGWKADEFYPQQSVSKFMVALTTMNQVDQGRRSLAEPVTLTLADLTVFHQPIRERILGNGGSYTTTVEALLTQAMQKSDNTCNDKLMRLAGGPDAVRDFIAGRRLGAIRFYNGERALQSRIAGLNWNPSYSIGDAFFKARDALPLNRRQALFNRYIDDPYDGAAPSALVNTLARLKRGELLSPASTAKLLTIMSNTSTGKNRLGGGLKPGWTLAHKTGTGQELGGVQAGYNDIGVLTAPNGRSYAVAVMIKKTSTPLIMRMNLMNDVVRAVIAQHEATYSGGLTL